MSWGIPVVLLQVALVCGAWLMMRRRWVARTLGVALTLLTVAWFGAALNACSVTQLTHGSLDMCQPRAAFYVGPYLLLR